MTSERLVRTLAGCFVLLLLTLGTPASPFYHGSHWLWCTALVGLNLLQSGFTGFCPTETLFCRLGAKRPGTLFRHPLSPLSTEWITYG